MEGLRPAAYGGRLGDSFSAFGEGDNRWRFQRLECFCEAWGRDGDVNEVGWVGVKVAVLEIVVVRKPVAFSGKATDQNQNKHVLRVASFYRYGCVLT